MPLDTLSVQNALRPELVEQLSPAEIIDLQVTEATDHDGDAVLELLVTFRSQDDRLDPARVLGLIRHLRAALALQGESRFPHVRFQTELEAQEEAGEAR